MRDIKFRVWSKEQEEFLVSYADKGELFAWESKFVGIDWFLQCVRCDNPIRFAVQQYTGLRDDQGEEIYEGDIIKSHPFGEVGEVRWISRSDGWDYSGWYSHPADLPFENELVKVVGNIYENPDFLEEKETTLPFFGYEEPCRPPFELMGENKDVEVFKDQNGNKIIIGKSLDLSQLKL